MDYYESKYTLKEETHRAVMLYNLKRPGFMVCHIIMSLYALYSFVLSLNGYIVQAIMLAVIPLTYLVLVLVRSYKTIKLASNQNREVNGGTDPEIVCIISEEGIKYSSSTGRNVQLDFSDIKKAVQTKEYIFLLSKSKLIYALKNDSFTFQKRQNLIEFLRYKGIKIK